MDDTLDSDRSIALDNWTMIKVVGRGANLGWVECRHQFRLILISNKRFCKNNDIKDIRIHNYNDHRWRRWNCTERAQKGFFPRGVTTNWTPSIVLNLIKQKGIELKQITLQKQMMIPRLRHYSGSKLNSGVKERSFLDAATAAGVAYTVTR